MTFNPLEEKGTPIDKQLRTWHDIALIPFNKTEVDCYTRTRQILMNGIEVEAWNFKHNFARNCNDEETNRFLATTKRIEDMQQTTVNWLTPSDQSILETTLGYEQVAVDLTAWMAQNEPDKYVKETFDFGLLEDFDHLYRYSQWAYMTHGISPNDIVQNQTDIILGRPTQNHHNCNKIRLRKPYDKENTSPQTKVNLYTLVSAEQQTHNYYAEHGMEYGNQCIRETYAEIKDVEEEHVNMYESLIDPTESWYEKLLLHEFTEVCNYYTCMEDEVDKRIKSIWEMFLDYELGHLQFAKELFEKHENKEAQSVIGSEIIIPNRFKSQKEYVTKVLESQIQKRLTNDKSYANLDDLPDNWGSYKVQEAVNGEGSPTENVIRIITAAKGRDLVIADEKLKADYPKLLEKGLENKSLAPDTVMPSDIKRMMKEEEIEHECE
ncbi:MAG: hypothetical protein MJ180_01640 [Candidatus Gastranaerophilales bacterium]|nr:hypothetical protein [Candidatus Gastranaerophilales bacterium]